MATISKEIINCIYYIDSHTEEIGQYIKKNIIRYQDNIRQDIFNIFIECYNSPESSYIPHTSSEQSEIYILDKQMNITILDMFKTNKIYPIASFLDECQYIMYQYMYRLVYQYLVKYYDSKINRYKFSKLQTEYQYFGYLYFAFLQDISKNIYNILEWLDIGDIIMKDVINHMSGKYLGV